jgi:hypothetical protein
MQRMILKILPRITAAIAAKTLLITLPKTADSHSIIRIA